MTRKIRFLHTADLHIGAPVRGFGDLSDAWKAKLQRAIPDAYDRVVDAALANSVDFVVLAGDAFDTSRPSYGDYLRFFEGMERLSQAGIPVYLIAGNHDPYTVWQRDVARLPRTARFMGSDGPEFCLFERDGEPLCLIGARGYRNQSWPVDESIAAGITRAAAVRALGGSGSRAALAPFCIGMVHTGLNIDHSKAYCDPDALLATDVDYWACGHLHKRTVVPSADDPRIVFPGCIQGRDLKESGERGCFVVTMEEPLGPGRPAITLDFVPTASVVFHTVKVDVGACLTLADVANHVKASLFHENAKASCDDMAVRVVLQGTTDLHAFLSRPSVMADLRKRINNSYPTFFCDAVVDRTRAPRDRAALLREGLFSGHVLRVAGEQDAHEQEMVNYVQAEFVKRGIDVPSSLTRRIGEFNAAAESLVLDLLDEEPE